MSTPRKRLVLRALLLSTSGILALALGLLLLLGAALNASWMLPFLNNAAHNLTGLAIEADRIRFRYPLDLRLEGLGLQGSAGGVDFRVHAAGVEIRSGVRALMGGTVDSVLVRDVRAFTTWDRDGQNPGGARVAETSREPPGWVGRVSSAAVRNVSIEVDVGHAPLRLEGLQLTWCGARKAEAGTLRVFLRDETGPEAALTVRVKKDRWVPGEAPVLLPDLSLASLAAFAGLDTPVSGTLTGTLAPLPALRGLEGIRLTLKARGLGVEGDGLAAGFDGGEANLDVLALFPPSMQGPPAFKDTFRLVAELSGSVRGGRFRDRTLPRDLDPLRFRVRAEADGGGETVAWVGEASDGQGMFIVRTQGTAAGILSGTTPEFDASLSLVCKDLLPAVALQAPALRLPGGFDWGGGAEASVRLWGTPESVEGRGEIFATEAFLSNVEGRSAAVRMNLGLRGRAGRSGIEQVELLTGRLALGELVTIDARGDYRPETVRWRMKTGPLSLQDAAAFLSPVLPEQVRGFEWGGELAASSHGEFTGGAGGRLKAGFRVRCAQGSFVSPDYQRMGEGIDLEVGGAVSLADRGKAPLWNAEALLSGGEIVHEGLYVNLAPLRPAIHLQGQADSRSGMVNLERFGVELAGVGRVLLSGNQMGRGAGTRRSADMALEEVDLGGLARLLEEGGLGERWPILHTLQGSGRLALRASLHHEGGTRPAVRGRVVVDEGSFSRELGRISVSGVRADLPFSVGPAESLDRLPGGTEDEGVEGLVSIARIDLQGLEFQELGARVRIHRDRFVLLEPLRAGLAGGRLEIREMFLSGLTSGEREGRGSLRLEDVDLEHLAGGLLGEGAEGRVSLWIPRAGLQDGRFFAESGGLLAQAGTGHLQVEEFSLALSSREDMECRFSLRAESFPLAALAAGALDAPAGGTLDGRLAPVTISDGRVRATGELRLSAWRGTVRVSAIRGEGLSGPNPGLGADVNIRGVHLGDLFSPDSFGRVSGVLQGDILGLWVGTRFPYVDAFRLELETVKVRGVPQKIGARAVENLSRVGGSSVLGAALSSGLLRLFEEYHYGKIGVSAVLSQGWLELYGIAGKRGGEYLILPSWRLPTLSMPLQVKGEDRRIRFGSWVSYVQGFGGSD